MALTYWLMADTQSVNFTNPFIQFSQENSLEASFSSPRWLGRASTRRND